MSLTGAHAWRALALCALAACDPGRFDQYDRRDADRDASRELDANGELAIGRDAASAAQEPAAALDAAAAERDAAAARDADDDAAQVDAGGCAVTPAGQTLPLVVRPGSLRVIARVATPSTLTNRVLNAIQPQGSKLLWTLLNTPRETSAPDGGVLQPTPYTSVARSPLAGPWTTDSASATNLMLDERVGANGLPLALVQPRFAPVQGNELLAVGLLSHGSEATLYLKQFYIFASVAIYTAQLGESDLALKEKPTLLFSGSANQALLGTGAFQKDSQVYALGCKVTQTDSGSGYPCWVGRGSAETPSDSASYEVFRETTGARSYTPLLDQGTPVLQGAETISLSYNPHLGLWLSITSGAADPNEGTAFLRTAASPEGPWSTALAMPMPLTAAGQTAHYVKEQPALASDCGRRLVLSYLEPSAPGTFNIPGNLALATLELQ